MMIEAEVVLNYCTPSSPEKRAPIDRFFEPDTIAVIGASDREGSVGKAVMANLASGLFAGRVFPVNPKRLTIGDQPCLPSVLSLPAPADLAIIAAPAIHVSEIIRECGIAGIGNAIVLSAGFSECGAAGAALEKQVINEARQGGVRIIGPNCLGIMRPSAGLNAGFSAKAALPGNTGFASQSGAL